MRIAVNAVSARPMRLEVVEAYVAGKPRNDETANAAGEIAVTGAVALAHNAYKIPMMRNLVKRAIRGGQRMGIDFCAMPAKAAIRPGVGGGCDNECSVTLQTRPMFPIVLGVDACSEFRAVTESANTLPRAGGTGANYA